VGGWSMANRHAEPPGEVFPRSCTYTPPVALSALTRATCIIIIVFTWPVPLVVGLMETEIDLVVYEYLASPRLPELFDESSVKPLMIKLRPTYDILKNERTSCLQ